MPRTSAFCVFAISALAVAWPETPPLSQSHDRPCLLSKSYKVSVDDNAHSRFSLSLQNIACRNCHRGTVENLTVVRNTSTGSLVLRYDEIRGNLSFLVSGRLSGEGVVNYFEEALEFAISNVSMTMTVKLARNDGDWGLTAPAIDRISFLKSAIPGLFRTDHRLVQVLKASLYNVLVRKCIYPRVLRLRRFRGPLDHETVIKGYIDKEKQGLPFLKAVVSAVKEEFRGETRTEISIPLIVSDKETKLRQVRAMLRGLDNARMLDDIEFPNITYEYRYDVKASLILGPLRVVLERSRYLQENITIGMQELSASLHIIESKHMPRQKTLHDVEIGKTVIGVEYSRNKVFNEDGMQSVIYGLVRNIEAKYRQAIEKTLSDIKATLHWEPSKT